jgi:hypothetical protein
MTDNEEPQSETGCFGRLMAEWRLGMFSTADVDGRISDMDAVFHPKPKLFTYPIKLLVFAWLIQVIVQAFSDFSSDKGFWFAYLTHWGTMSVLTYFTLSLICLMRPIKQDPTNLLTRATWFVFTTTVNLELVITLLYWVLEYEGGTPNYTSVMQHGGFMLVVMIDGFLINRIPIRFKQVLGFFVMELLYLIWSGIHAATTIGNPRREDNDPETDDDAIYSAVNWSERPVAAVIVALLVLFVGTPIIFMIMWFCSSWRRWYLPNQEEEEAATKNIDQAPNDEEQPIFASAEDSSGPVIY